MAAVNLFYITGLCIESIDDCFISGDECLKFIEFCETDNFFFFDFDLFDEFHWLDFNDGHESFFSADGQVAWMYILDIGDSFCDNSFSGADSRLPTWS